MPWLTGPIDDVPPIPVERCLYTTVIFVGHSTDHPFLLIQHGHAEHWFESIECLN